MEKKVLPLLLIVVLFTMLFSTYAWFSLSKVTIGSAVIESGTATGIVLATNASGGGSSFSAADLKIGPYEGQKAFKTDGSAYRPDEADYAYTVDANLEYLFRADSNVRLLVTLKQVVVEFDETYNLTPAVTLAEIFNIPTVLPKINTTINDYIFTDINDVPNDIPCGCVVAPSNENKVLKVFMKDEYALKFFEFDYWASDNSNDGKGIERPNSSSALTTGIEGIYGEGGNVSKSGTINYMKIFVGFYGKNESNVYNQPFFFSHSKYQGSLFRFYFLARVVND